MSKPTYEDEADLVETALVTLAAAAADAALGSDLTVQFVSLKHSADSVASEVNHRL